VAHIPSRQTHVKRTVRINKHYFHGNNITDVPVLNIVLKVFSTAAKETRHVGYRGRIPCVDRPADRTCNDTIGEPLANSEVNIVLRDWNWSVH
jgi:hypothetical protein